MARVAFIMDRIFRKFGLSGKSFIPMLIGTGCGVPGVMASRTIENDRDRKMTIMTTTFIPCGDVYKRQHGAGGYRPSEGAGRPVSLEFFRGNEAEERACHCPGLGAGGASGG